MLGAAGLTLAQASSASAVEYVAQSQAGTVEAPGGMVIGSDTFTGTDMVPRIQAGALRVGASPAKPEAQRVVVSASLQRYDEAGHAWRSTGQSGQAQVHLNTPSDRELVGSGTQASNWAFTTSQVAAAQYRVSYVLTWFETHDDADASNDTVVGQAVIRPSETSENVCDTTPFGNATTVVYEVPCTVTAQGIVI